MLEQIFEVALALGFSDPRKMLEEMDVELLMYWIAFLDKKKRANTKQDYALALLTKVCAEKDTKVNRNLEKYMISIKSNVERDEEQRKEEDQFINWAKSIPGVSVT